MNRHAHCDISGSDSRDALTDVVIPQKRLASIDYLCNMIKDNIGAV